MFRGARRTPNYFNLKGRRSSSEFLKSQSKNTTQEEQETPSLESGDINPIAAKDQPVGTARTFTEESPSQPGLNRLKIRPADPGKTGRNFQSLQEVFIWAFCQKNSIYQELKKQNLDLKVHKDSVSQEMQPSLIIILDLNYKIFSSDSKPYVNT